MFQQAVNSNLRVEIIALIVAGQMIGSLAFDHLGLFGLPMHHVTAPRVAGALFLLAGAVLVRC